MNRRNQDRALLSILLRGEVAAADAYRCALRDADRNACAKLWIIHSEMSELEGMHRRQAGRIASFLDEAETTEEVSPGIWGWFTRVLVWFAAVGKGSRPTARVLSLLREGEQYGRCQMQSMLPDVSDETRRFIEERLLADQTDSLERMTRLANARKELEEQVEAATNCGTVKDLALLHDS